MTTTAMLALQRRLLSIVLLWLPLNTVTCFSPTAPPRFDVFCETIVGNWMTPQQSSTKPQSVDEVMRSCGGAVQGIKEMLCHQEFYLNRSDDGFVFFDCGSYSYGPVDSSTTPTSITSHQQQDDHSISYMASLSIPKARIVMKTSGHLGEDRLVAEAMMYPKATFRGESDFLPETPLLINKPDYDITRQLQCRMSSPSQLWMMQRLQWEADVANEDDAIVEQIIVPPRESEEEGSYQCWLEQLPAQEDGSANPVMTISMGMCCTMSGYVKEIIRSYNGDNGKLTRVKLQEGRLKLKNT